MGQGKWDSSSGFPHRPPSSALLDGHTGRCRAEGKLNAVGSDACQQDSPARPPNPAPQSHTGQGKPEPAHFCCAHAMPPALRVKCEAWKGCRGLRACSGLLQPQLPACLQLQDLQTDWVLAWGCCLPSPLPHPSPDPTCPTPCLALGTSKVSG